MMRKTHRQKRETDRPAADPLDMATAAGDVRSVLALLRDRPCLGRTKTVETLRQTLVAAAGRPPGAYVDELYALMLAASADLLAFTHGVLHLQLKDTWHLVERDGVDTTTRTIPEQLALLERLHEHVMTLTKAWATVGHTMRIGEDRNGPSKSAAATDAKTPAPVPAGPDAVPSPAPEEPSASEASMPRPRRRKRRRTDPASDVLPLLDATAELAETVEHDVPSALTHHCDAELLETCGVDLG